MRGSAIIRWTGRGRVEDLQSSVKEVLRAEGVRVRVRLLGSSVVVDKGDPVGVAILLQHLPGVRWIAVGHSAGSLAGLAANAKRLARIYLQRGRTFSVVAEVGKGATTPSDVSGLLSSVILGEVTGARTDEDKPQVCFRAAYDRGEGVVGVELKQGLGGTPTGNRTVDCLISGGMHSAVVAWHALLSGFGVHLLHAKVSEESLKEVAKLYAEFSNWVDPRRLSLEVLEEGGIESLLSRPHGRQGGLPLAGFHTECGGVPEPLAGKVLAPLALLTEEEFEKSFSGLSVGKFVHRQDWGEGAAGRGRWRSFGGVRTDMHGVLDGLT